MKYIIQPFKKSLSLMLKTGHSSNCCQRYLFCITAMPMHVMGAIVGTR